MTEQRRVKRDVTLDAIKRDIEALREHGRRDSGDVTLGLGQEAAAELDRAIYKFGPMASPHEGWAVIREEVDELWEHVKANTGRSDEARLEAIQIAAMALRYVADLCDGAG